MDAYSPCGRPGAQMICPSCDISNADREPRCRRCAAPLPAVGDEAVASSGAAGKSTPERREPEGTRRQRVHEVRRPVDPGPPPGVRVQPSGDALRITRRWFHPLSFVVVLVLAPLLIWCGVTGRAGALVSARYATLANVTAMALGVSCLYLLGWVLFNRTVIEITFERLSVSHGPLPAFMARRVVAARDIARVFCVEHAMSVDLGVSDYDYELKATLADGQVVSLLEDIPNLKQARYLKQEIELRLGIADRPGAGD